MRVATATIAAALLLPLASTTPIVVAVDLEAVHALGAALPLAAQQTAGQQDRQSGTWEIRPTSTEGIVHLRLVESNSSSGTNTPVQRLEGLTAAQLTGAGGPVQFRLRRDAGTFAFEGVIRNGIGAGTFSFAPEPNFPAELAKRGFARPSALEQYQLARHDIGYAFLDELVKQGYAKPQPSELVRAPLITLRDHGVTPAYAGELASLGLKGLSADDLRRARDHGVTPEYVRAMRDAGYSALTMEQLVKARDHGVNLEFVREIKALGYEGVTIEDLVTLRDHGLTAERHRAANARAGSRLPVDLLKSLASGGR